MSSSSLRFTEKQREAVLVRHHCLAYEISRLVHIEQLVFEQLANHMITYSTDQCALSHEATEFAAMILEAKSRRLISWSKAFRRVLAFQLQLDTNMLVCSCDARNLYEISDIKLYDKNDWLVANNHQIDQHASLQKLQKIAERYYERLLVAMDNMIAVVIDANRYGKSVCVDLRQRNQKVLDRLKQLSKERPAIDEVSMQIEELTLE